MGTLHRNFLNIFHAPLQFFYVLSARIQFYVCLTWTVDNPVSPCSFKPSDIKIRRFTLRLNGRFRITAFQICDLFRSSEIYQVSASFFCYLLLFSDFSEFQIILFIVKIMDNSDLHIPHLPSVAPAQFLKMSIKRPPAISDWWSQYHNTLLPPLDNHIFLKLSGVLSSVPYPDFPFLSSFQEVRAPSVFCHAA